MKALYITHLYPPRHIGGTEHYTHSLAKGVIALGHQTQVLCVGDWEQGERYWNGQSDDIFEGVPVRRLHLNWRKAPDIGRYSYDNPMVADYTRNYLKEIAPDVVHVTSCNTLSASVIGAAKQLGLPVVVTLTDFWFVCPRVTLMRSDGGLCDGRVAEQECVRCLFHGSKAYRWSRSILPEAATVQLLGTLSRHGTLSRLRGVRGMAMDIRDRRARVCAALQQADRVLIASRSARDTFRLNGVSIPIAVVPYGHDLSWLERYTGKTESRMLRLGFVGQISAAKGPQLLIEAYKNASHGGAARLLIYGDMEKDPVFGGQLRSLANGRQDIEFRGTYPHAESGRVFSEIDVLVVPSLWNDYPLIIHEAFATRTPVVASDSGAMKEFVQPGVNGLLFQRGSSEDLARQLRRLIVERDLPGRLGAAVPHVKSIAEAVAEMLMIYRDAMDTPILARDQGACAAAQPPGTEHTRRCREGF